ncbi:DAK2 domain-containing protein [Clostridium sp. D2Q-11]|uniref:DAK2 domain-containing protein n=1 Tax=Anaeromonas frigoriresistens TaxID=2683708 RepID=A0A942UVB4_9FIRM|nr:DAK2 domain-containing protein [Anaeromonas frigoriresistens]MBS4539748.1 DAK2 domain-containing protein [Anaeromonas frigoriresistens]
MKIEYLKSTIVKKAFVNAANKLDENKETVNSLNVFPVPDGDTGTNMSLTMQSAVKHIRNNSNDSIESIASAASSGSLMGARGNSGVILSQLLRGFSKGLQGKEVIDVETLANSFKLASETAYKAVMKPIEGTILTVAREVAEKAQELVGTEDDIQSFLEKVIEQGEDALRRTPDMLDVLKQAGVVDAGGKGLIYILKGGLEAITGKEIVISDEDFKKEEIKIHQKATEDGEIKFGYCTEFIINKTEYQPEEFRNYISKYGDSMLVVGSEGVIKVHIHTNNPGEVLEEALKIGELIDIKIDNMRFQHRNQHIEDNDLTQLDKKDNKKYSFITISMGKGIENVFKDLNADFIISGGQTMNPSTEDILSAIDKVTGENIIILPNNSNIILAANQAKELSERNIEVLSTKTIPQGISALLAFDEELELEDNLENMKDAITNIITGQITYAVRDTSINNKEIKKDDIIGITNGDIKAVGSSINEVTLELLKESVDEDNDIITLFYGEDVEEKDANELAEKLQEEFEDLDVETIYGGQPLYYYLISIE